VHQISIKGILNLSFLVESTSIFLLSILYLINSKLPINSPSQISSLLVLLDLTNLEPDIQQIHALIVCTASAPLLLTLLTLNAV